MYREFFYELVLTALLLVHCVYRWRQWRTGEDREPWKKSAAVFIGVLAALCAGAVIAGAAVVIARGDPAASMGLGALSILMAIWLDFKVARACGK